MEPFRPFIDEIVCHLYSEGSFQLDTQAKAALLSCLSCDTYYPKVTRPLQVGLSITMASLARCYAGEQKDLSLPTLK